MISKFQHKSTSGAELGRLIREARKAKGLSQDELALIAGLSRRPIYLLETGQGSVRLDTLFAILDALGLALILTGRGSMTAD